MQLILRQSFPLGRFHATFWKANPFDKEVAGEWPPSPWRLTRAVVARWYQWRRETTGIWAEDELEDLIRALCGSNYSFYLPEQAFQVVVARQYQPAEFGMDPPNFKSFEAKYAPSDGVEQKLEGVADSVERDGSYLLVRVEKKSAQKQVERVIGKPIGDWQGLDPDSGMRDYATNLTQDNALCLPPDKHVLWFIEGHGWTPGLMDVLDRCLERITYFGRAEAFTRISRTDEAVECANVTTTKKKTVGSFVPVLVPKPDAKRADIERVTEDRLAARNIPQGACLLYAERPPRQPARELPRPTPKRSDRHLIQFALGWAVPPEPRATVRLTARFRAAVLRNLIRLRTNGAAVRWSDAPADIREAIAEMTGKDSRGEPLRGPRRHAEFLLWWDGDAPTRLLVWRGARAFDGDEQEAILRAAAQELSWAAAGPDAEAWKIKLIPLDNAVAPPPGFDGVPRTTWETLTPYVPPRHNLRGGKVRESETIANQIRRELAARDYLSDTELRSVEEIAPPIWVAVHVPRRQADQRQSLGARRGYRLRIVFSHPIVGPVRLGHSSSFGLGLFSPSAA
jgi:CRISPR-associated protein Csb2